MLWLVYDDSDNDEYESQNHTVNSEIPKTTTASIVKDEHAIESNAVGVVVEDIKTSDDDNARVTNWTTAVNRIDSTKATSPLNSAIEQLPIINSADEISPPLATDQDDNVETIQASQPVESVVASDDTVAKVSQKAVTADSSRYFQMKSYYDN